jgi:hypothetical protein
MSKIVPRSPPSTGFFPYFFHPPAVSALSLFEVGCSPQEFHPGARKNAMIKK